MTSKKSLEAFSLSPRGKWILSEISGERILDIGFVADKNFTPDIYLAVVDKLDTSFVVGLDINLKKVIRLGFPNTVSADMFHLPFRANSFDTVLIAEVFEHLTSIDAAISEISYVTRPGGKVIVTTPNPYGIFRVLKHWYLSAIPGRPINFSQFLGNYDHKVFWEPLSLCNLFNSFGFEIAEVTTTNISIPYLPSFLKNPNLAFWPFNRLGTYSCFEFRKIA